MSKNKEVRLVLAIQEGEGFTPVPVNLKGLIIEGEFVLPLGEPDNAIACLRMLIDILTKHHA